MVSPERRQKVSKVSVLPTVGFHKCPWDVIITPDQPGSCWALTCFLTVELRLPLTPPNHRGPNRHQGEKRENGIKNNVY